MTMPKRSDVTRRRFCRDLALPAGALLLGGGAPAWAKKKQEAQTPTSPGAAGAKIKCETKVLWDFDGCLEDRFMKRITSYVYNGNVYCWVLLPEYQTMIVKVPLNGGKAQICPLMPGHVTGADPHRYYTIAADALGHIHVCGDMHTSPNVKHWVSKRPEDISEFVFTSDLGENKRPQGHTVTYPHLFRSPDGVLYHSIRCAEPAWGIGISVLDAKTQTWTMLGADVPASELPGNRAKKAKGRPMTAWEDNGEGGNFGYTQPHAHIAWDNKKRMHVVFSLLNENTPSAKGRHTGTHVLYAYSDDGGKTFHRGNGSLIQLPMRAEAGPHQADIVYARQDGNPPWVGLNPGIHFDDKDRPIVNALDHKTGLHRMLLDNGKWTEIGKGGADDSEAAAARAAEADDDATEGLNMSKFDLQHDPFHPNPDYWRETGNLLYFSFPDKDRFHGYKPKFHRVLLVHSKPLQEKS